MTDNPLVAGPVDTATPFSGAGLLDSGTQLASAIESGNWVEGGLAAFSVGLDAVATAMDPFGSLLAAGLGWLMDHFEPLKGWLNDLTGDAGEVQAFAQTWNNVAVALQASGNELIRILSDVDTQAGEAMDAYRRFQQDAAAHINAAGSWSGALGIGLGVAATIVQIVHDLVRDVIAQLVGSAISWAAQVVFSFGLATPWVVSQVATRVASLSAKVGTQLTALLNSIRKLVGLLDELRAVLRQSDELMSGVLKGGPVPPTRLDDAAQGASRADEAVPPRSADDAAPVDQAPALDERPYLDPASRPSYRKGVVDDVWGRAVDGSPDRIVRDPNTGEVIDWIPGEPRRGVWDMGHVQDAKYSDMHQRYLDGELTPAEFRDWYNDPDNYRPETPAANRGHRYE